jgi:hypothetical protein
MITLKHSNSESLPIFIFKQVPKELRPNLNMQPMKPLERIAIVGVSSQHTVESYIFIIKRAKATGHIGKVFVKALLENGQHQLTALTRPETKGTLPEGVERIQVDFSNQDSLVAALQGQQFLIITLAVTTDPGVHNNIIYAAASAGVPYVMPNFYGSDIRNPKLGEEAFGAIIKSQLGEMERVGVSYASLACGTWYEWSVALGESWFGFTIPERKVTFFDDGETRVNMSSWPQCGRAVTALLSLPQSGASPCLADWRNEPVYITSFNVS